jgi:hypothetical protein
MVHGWTAADLVGPASPTRPSCASGSLSIGLSLNDHDAMLDRGGTTIQRMSPTLVTAGLSSRRMSLLLTHSMWL